MGRKRKKRIQHRHAAALHSQQFHHHLRGAPNATGWAAWLLFGFRLFTEEVFFLSRPWKLTHNGSWRLRVVAQRLKVCGESWGSVHSSGTAVRCGPLPFSQMYRATWNDTEGADKWVVVQSSLEASLNEFFFHCFKEISLSGNKKSIAAY